MAYGLVQDTTLTRMGNALRNKRIVPETREETIYVSQSVCKTLNATGFDTWSGQLWPEGIQTGDTYSFEETLIFDGASSVEVDIGYKFSNYSDVGVKILADGYDPVKLTGNGSGGTPLRQQLTFNNVSSVTFVLEGLDAYGYGDVSGYFFYAEATGKDADGNPIEGNTPQQVTVTNTLTPDKMADAIENVLLLPESTLEITGDCERRFSNGGWDWFINDFGDKITTKDITRCSHMFFNSEVSEIPFVINIKDCYYFNNMFYSAGNLEKCPKIRGTIKWGTTVDMADMLSSTTRLRDVEDLFTLEMMEGFSTIKVTSAYSTPKACDLRSMASLRTAPSWFYKQRLNPESTSYPNYSYGLYYYLCNNCYALGEITNIPVWKCAGKQTSNMFNSAFQGVSRAKDITFETNADGSPIVTEWKSQIINLTRNVGYGNALNFYGNNSGLTKDTWVEDSEDYQALKDNPDWYTNAQALSRYNHDSAVTTINSLPDTSAYLASAGGTNTIKFDGFSGSSTDGGAINTLTEAEIAVAAAKGWTVTM